LTRKLTAAHVRNSSAAQRASELLGVGPVTASALAAKVSDARIFKSGRHFGAWLGLTPRQHSSGGKTRLGRISLRGNVYLRTLLIQGARSTLQAAMNRERQHGPVITTLDHRPPWPQGLLQDVDRHRQQACPDPLGHARQGRTLRCVGVATARHEPTTARR